MRPQWLGFILLALMPGVASADFFTFNATSNPTTGTYTPVGSGHYTLIGEAESFSNLDATDLLIPGDQAGVFLFAQSETIPTMPGLTCTYPYPIGCDFNYVKYFSTPDGTPIAMIAAAQAGVGIYDSSGDPLALMLVEGGSSATYSMLFITSATYGAPLNLGAQPPYIQDSFAGFPHIVATGALQDAIDVHWDDGSVDSFQFILQPVPEPTSLIFLGTVAVAVGMAIRRRRRSCAAMVDATVSPQASAGL